MHYVLYAYQVLFTSIVIFNKIKKSIPHALSHPPPSEKCYNSLEGLSCIDSACLLDTYTLACKHWTSQFKNYFFPLSI